MTETRRPAHDLLPTVFTAAEARAVGLRPDRQLGAGLVRLARGIYASAAGEGAPILPGEAGAALDAGGRIGRVGSSGEDPIVLRFGDAHPDREWRRSQVERARLLSARAPPGAFFSHHTAAALWGLPVPARAGEALDLGFFLPRRGSRKAAFLVHHFVEGSVVSSEVCGVPVSDPASTWLMLASRLPRSAAVALGDAVLYAPRYPGSTRLKRPPLASLAEIQRLIAMPHRRGRRHLAALAELLSASAASPPESHLRLLLRDWGVPEPELDWDVLDAEGRLIGCSEIAFVEQRLALEYEGDHHRVDPHQWNRDIEKYRAYASAGWEVLRVTAALLYRQPETLRAQVEEALARRAG